MNESSALSTLAAVAPWLIALLLSICAYFLRTLHVDLRKLIADFNSFNLKVVETYATKADLHDAQENCGFERRRIHKRIDDLDERVRDCEKTGV